MRSSTDSKPWEYNNSDWDKIKALAAKSYNEIKQGIIDSLKDIQYDVVSGKIEEVTLKINKARKYVDAFRIKLTSDKILHGRPMPY